MILAVAAALAFSSPQAAAIAITYRENKSTPVVVVRTNVAGQYASVLLKGAMMEGSPEKVPILFERFAFGWQPLESLNFRCRLSGHRLGMKVEGVLMRGMPAPGLDNACDGEVADTGSSGDVAAVRMLMRGPLVPTVIVSGNWALGTWYGAGGGNTLFERKSGAWKFVKSGGGAMDVGILRAFGVPAPTACALAPDDRTCK